MKVKAHIVIIPEDLTLEEIFEGSPDFEDYVEDRKNRIDNCNSCLNELKSNLETKIDNNIDSLIYYYILDYLKDNNCVYGEISIPGHSDKVINLSIKDMTEATKNHILQCGILDNILGGIH